MTARRRRAVVATTIVIAVVATTISIWLVATRARTPAQRAAAPPSELTAIVEKGPLSDEFTLDGRLRQQSQLPISGPEVTNGRSVVTDLPVKRGDRVENRQLVAVVSGRPVIALEGKFDSYRDLHLGDKGPDVRQLRLALGLWGDDDYDDATAKSVARLWASGPCRAHRVGDCVRYLCCRGYAWHHCQRFPGGYCQVRRIYCDRGAGEVSARLEFTHCPARGFVASTG